MRRSIPLSLAAILMTLFARPAAAKMVDAVAATVDKEVVLYSSLMRLVGGELRSLQEKVSSQQEYQEEASKLVHEALEEAINTLLLAREARKIPQLEVTEKDLDLIIDEMRKDFDTPEKFIQEVGSMSEFRERQRQMLLARRMGATKMQAFSSEVVVSEDEISTYYQEHSDEYSKPERVFLRQIFLRVRDDAERPQAREKLEQLRQEALSGTDFADLAKQHSQALGAEEGGIVGDGWQRRSTPDQPGDLNEAMEQAAFALPAGGVSEIIEDSGGLHLLKVDKHEQAGTAPVAEVRLEIEAMLRQEAAQKKYDTWIDDLRKRSRVRKFI